MEQSNFSRRHGRIYSGQHVFVTAIKKDVDARDKRGHDGAKDTLKDPHEPGGCHEKAN
jgi:hypothetical protein